MPPPQSHSLKALDDECQRALALQQRQQLPQAEALYRKLLKRAPRHFDALHLFGGLLARSNRLAEGITLLQKAAEVRPDSAAAHNSLGIALSLEKRFDEALASYERSLALKPLNPKAWANRGKLLRKLKRPQDALASLERALEIDPDLLEARLNVSELLAMLSEQNPERKQEYRAAAADNFRKAIALGGNAEELRYHLAALGALGTGEAPAASPRQYVATLFDDYADRFDEHLTQLLKYQTPQLLCSTIERLVAPRDADVLDLGCGTGLCGPLLRPMARRLIGVDLSGNMLAKARELGLYDELVCAELIEHLQPQQACQDLVLAADVFVYIGDLAPVFAATHRALRPGGHFAFSVEAHEGSKEFVLPPTRRYAHARHYLERLAAAQGFETRLLEGAKLRENRGEAVLGTLALFRKN